MPIKLINISISDITMKILIVLCLVALVHSNKRTSDIKECSDKGPDFWCKNEQTANKCSALHYCKTYKWKSTASGTGEIKENLDTCTTCQQIIGTAHVMLENNATKAEVIHLLEGVCMVLPEMLKLACDEMISLESAKIIKFLMDNTKDPRQLCTAMHMCSGGSRNGIAGAEYGSLVKEVFHNNNQQIMPGNAPINSANDYIKFTPENVANVPVAAPSNDMCSLCQQVIGTVRLILKRNESQAAVLAELTSVCQYLPTAEQGYCVAAVKMYGPTLIKMLLDHTQDPRPICRMLHLCDYTKVTPENVPKVAVAAPSNDMCSLCQQVIGTARLILKRNESQAAVLAELTSVCQYLPTAEQGYCVAAVKMYGPTLIKMLLNHTQDPRPICRMLYLCAQGCPLVQIKPASTNGICETCMDSVSSLHEALVKYNTTIIRIIEVACMDLPSQIRPMCKSYLPELYNEVLDYLSHPEELCKEFHLCSAKKNLNKEVAPQKSLEKSNGITCEVCELLMQKLDNMLKGNKTKKAVKEDLEKLCDDIPWSKQCKSLVNTYSDQILNMVISELKDTDKVCRSLGLCASAFRKKNSNKEIASPKSLDKPNGITCDICELLIKKLDDMLVGKKTKAEMKEALEKVCDHFPWSEQCKSFVDTYSDQILDMVVSDLKDTHKVCRKLHLCASAFILKGKNGFIKCEMCVVGVELVISTSRGRIAYFLNALCDLTDNKTEAVECRSIVKNLTAKITSGVHGQAICKFVGYCDASAQIHTLLPKEELPTCNLCSFMSGKLDASLKASVSKKMIKAQLKSACSRTKFSPDEMDNCQRIIDENRKMIVELTKSTKLPTLCKSIGHCVAGLPLSLGAQLRGSLDMRRGGLSNYKQTGRCTVCQYVMGILDEALGGHGTKAKIIAKVHTLCNRLPREIFKTECNALIGEYGGELIDLMIENLLQPKDVCKHFGLC